MHQSEPSILKRSGGYYFYLGKRAWNLMDFQTLTYAQRNLREPLSPPCQREEACNEIHSVSTRLRHQMCGGRCIKSNLPLTFCEASRWPLHVTCGSLNSFFFFWLHFAAVCWRSAVQRCTWVAGVRLPWPLHFSPLQLINWIQRWTQLAGVMWHFVFKIAPISSRGVRVAAFPTGRMDEAGIQSCATWVSLLFSERFDVKRLLKHLWDLIRDYMSVVNHRVQSWKPHLFFQSRSFVRARSRPNKAAFWLENHIHYIPHNTAIVSLPTNVFCFLDFKTLLFDI